MNLLEGLKLIDKCKLPHPEWQFVRQGSELKNLDRISAYAGWTIRIVDSGELPRQRLFVNLLATSRVTKTIDKFRRKLSGPALFVVYPSWHWLKSGTLLVGPKRVVVEAVRGEIDDLTHRGYVDSQYVFIKNNLVTISGNKNLLSNQDLRQIIKPTKNLSRGNYYLEWVITTRKRFMFFHLSDLAAEGKALLAKYGGK